MPRGNFKLSQLKLDQRNVRTGPQPGQREALLALIEDQKVKLANLAQDLLDMNGPSPGEPIWVTEDRDEPGRFIVLEGNRRVAALKLMENPQMAAGTVVAGRFAEMAKTFAARPIRDLEAQVFNSREEAQPWIDRRHMSAASGVGLQPWRSLAKSLSVVEYGGPIRRSLAVLRHLDDGSDEFGAVGEAINKKATTVDRVLNSPAIRDALGIHIEKKGGTIRFDGDEEAGRRALKDIVLEMAKPDFKFSTVRDAEDRDAFVRSFGSQAPGAAGPSPTPTPTPTPSVGSSPPAGGTVVPFKSPLKPPPRPTLAPGGSRQIPKVKGDRLRKLYKECREVRLDGGENAAALLLRVFIELSSETLLIEKSAPLPPKLTGKPKPVTDWGEIGVTLHEKVSAVLLIIDTTPRTTQQLKEVRVALNKGSHAPGSINTLHAYVHNVDFMPRPQALREAWDTWEAYLNLLHAARI